MSQPQRVPILYIDDYPFDRELVRDALMNESDQFDLYEAASREEFEDALAGGRFDLVLTDFNILGFEGLQVLEAVHDRYPNVPVIIVTGTGSEEIAVEAMKRGAADYVIKKPSHIQRLPFTIRAALEKIRDITDRKRAEAALLESQAQLRGIIQTTMEAIISVDEDQRIVIFNPSAERIFQYPAAEALGQPFDLFLPEPSRQRHRDFIRQFGDTNVSHRRMKAPLMDLTCVRASGERFPSEISISQLETSGKKLFTAVIRDITERKQSEERIARQIAYLNALRVIDQAIASTFDLGMSLQTLLAQTLSLLSVDAAAVLLFQPTRYTLEFAAGLGFQTRAIELAKIPMGEGLAGKAALERRLVEIPNLAFEPENALLSIGLKDENFVSYHGMPLIAKGKVIGVLELFHRSIVTRDKEWLDFLINLSGQAAIAIDNAQLFENLQRSNFELSQAYDATIEGWSRALDLRDRETEGHTLRVVERTLELAKKMGIGDGQLVQIHRGALLHDIGKLGIPDGILLKPGPLTEDEWALMRKHPVFAYEMLSPIRYLSGALDIPYCHHEKWDGTGYPRGLKGEQIPLTARIFAVVDVYDAVTSDRPYRSAWKRDDALNYIRSLSGKQFDPEVVRMFLEIV